MLKFFCGKRVNTFTENDLIHSVSSAVHGVKRTYRIVPSDFNETGSDLVSQEVVRTKSVEPHVSTDANELRTGQIVESEVSIE